MNDMIKINLLGNLRPLTKKPALGMKKSKKKSSKKILKKSEQDASEEKTDPEIKTIFWCGCGNHPINPNKDPYMQHNKWAAQFHPRMESGRADIRGVKGIRSSKKKPVPTYDFSGEEFELTNAELKNFKNE